MQNNKVVAAFDGACEPFNPGGHMGLGWVINGEPHCRYIAATYGNSNNVAEYLALIEVLKHAISHAEITEMTITGDSQLVCCQLCGEYAVRSENIFPLFDRANSLISTLERRGCSVRVNWLPRDYNVAADAASKLALTNNGITQAERKPPAGYTPRLGDIGRRLSISAIKAGKMLDAAGLRANRVPTDRALKDEVARERFDGFGIVTDWNIDKLFNLVKGEIDDCDQRNSSGGSRAEGQKFRWTSEETFGNVNV